MTLDSIRNSCDDFVQTRLNGLKCHSLCPNRLPGPLKSLNGPLWFPEVVLMNIEHILVKGKSTWWTTLWRRKHWHLGLLLVPLYLRNSCFSLCIVVGLKWSVFASLGWSCLAHFDPLKGRWFSNIAYSFILLSSVVQYALHAHSNHGHEDEENPNYLQGPGHFIEEQHLEELQSFLKLRHR